jgi:hypothetical protein
MALTHGDGGGPVEFEPMSPEEMQRTMQFLLAQQAHFAADFGKLTANTDRIADAIIGLTGIVGRIADQQERLGDQLARQQERTDQQIREVIPGLTTSVGTSRPWKHT